MSQIGNFAIQEFLGEGGMSLVWRGVHTTLGVDAAIKVLRPEYAGRDRHRAAFLAEARNHAKLLHPGILRLYDVGELHADVARDLTGVRISSPFIAMERAIGSLEDDLPLRNWTQTYTVLLEILDALAHAHARGVVHRDLKPGNVMRVRHHDTFVYRIGDFGLAHARDSTGEADVTMGATAGTPMYMAPEQVNGLWRDFGPPTDLYALGCVAFRLVTGNPPFDGETVFHISRGHTSEPTPPLRPRFAAPAGLAAWIAQLMQKRPADRFQRAADAAQALHALASGFRDPDSSRDEAQRWALVAELDPTATKTTAVRASDGLGLFDLTEPPLVGRDAEIQALTRALNDARDHRGSSVVILRGPPGVGLTRLANAFATRMDELGLARVHRATHSPIQAEHEGLAGMLAAHYTTWGLQHAEVRQRVRDALPPADRDPAVATAVANLIFRVDEHVGAARYALIDRALRAGHGAPERTRATRTSPSVFVFDDVQWGRETLEFVRDRVDDDIPAVFILTVRDQSDSFVQRVLNDLAARPSTTILDVAPPTLEEVTSFVAALLDFADDVPGKVAAAAGRDFRLARQIVGSCLEDGVLALRDGRFALLDDNLPTGWSELWRRRLAAVLRDAGAPDRALYGVEIAAELGPIPVPTELLDALDRAEVDLDARVQELLFSRGLLVRPIGGGWWAFAEQSLLQHLRERTRTHGRIAAWSDACADAIARRPPTRDRASRIAWHLLQAGNYEAAFAPLRAAILGFAAADPERAREYLGWWLHSCDALRLDEHAPQRRDATSMAAQIAQR